MTIEPFSPILINPGPLTEAQYQAFKAGLPDWKYVLLAKILRATGLRIGEVLKLEARHYFVAGPGFWLAAQRTKKRKIDPGYEQLFMPPELGVEVRDYIKGQQIKAGQRVFKISARQVQRVFNKAGWDTIGREIHPHEMRHLFITWALENGMTVEMVAKYVGHSNTKTTLQWYYELTAEKRKIIGENMPI